MGQQQQQQQRALVLFEEAFHRLQDGEMEEAVRLYKASIAEYPTAEAYTSLGWAYSCLGDFSQAIAECLRAISLDPDLGDPYNDIGVYLLAQDELDEAIPWFEKAIGAPCYETPGSSWMSLGQIYMSKELPGKARSCFERAKTLGTDDDCASEAYEEADLLIN